MGSANTNANSNSSAYANAKANSNDNANAKANEITVPTNLCDEAGNLNQNSIGWAKTPLIGSNLSGSYLRKKRWNYWAVTTPDVLFSATISHLDYAAVMFVYILDLKTLRFFEKTELVPFGKGVHMPEKVNASLQYAGKNLMIGMEEKGAATEIKVECPNFSGKGVSLSANLMVHRPDGHESLNVVVPWSDKHFQYTSKQPTLPTEGEVRWGEDHYHFSKKEAFACLDFGRGKWPYSSTWNWASASGETGGHVVGLNFGGQWTDGTGQNENGIVVDGKLTKIHEDIVWKYDKTDFMKPWTLRSEKTDAVSLTFEPLFERTAATKAVVIQSEVHQMIGIFKGHVKTVDGKTIAIDSLLGWAEDHMARW
ncbi:DUF2804 domain-containing protein [Bacillus alkalicola]|uniref:DUF2804 domain-containing protein n=2 Tax=Bacillales TaxID=1385 RepID=A0ABS6K297_9BACI|nr:DUF2804 domain-containing protein [Bacillus alkalicola]